MKALVWSKQMDALRSKRRVSCVDNSVAQSVLKRLRDSAAHHFGLQLRPVQVTAGTQMLRRCIAEMQTGEGKTLATVLPASVLATLGRKMLIATANDYLAARDADWMGPLYRDLGLTVGCVTSNKTPEQRQAAYRCQVTYGTIREFGFDFLRDSLAARPAKGRAGADGSSPLLRDLDVLVVDEADSVLIDEARTPLVISAPLQQVNAAREACFRWAAETAAGFRAPDDYIRLAHTGAIALTEQGRRRVVHMPMPTEMDSLTITDILHGLERAIWVNQTIHRNSQYVVNDNAIALVDDYTGRSACDRTFSGGIHQAIEAREQLPLTPLSEPIARITIQDFASRFAHLCGITATAWEDRRELYRVYGLNVTRIPTHAASRRRVLPPAVRRDMDDKWQWIADEIVDVIQAGRAVLVGTRTVTQSESLSRILHDRAIEHVVLNARNPQEESRIIADAGKKGRVTVATNMAGRGTDIRLDQDVADAGGLHVIVSQPHAAARIDRQLIGRCGRQGDPGSARLFVSPDDDILEQAYGDVRAAKMRQSLTSTPRWLLWKLRRAQAQVARRHRQERARLTAADDSVSDLFHDLGLDPHLDPLPDHS